MSDTCATSQPHRIPHIPLTSTCVVMGRVLMKVCQQSITIMSLVMLGGMCSQTVCLYVLCLGVRVCTVRTTLPKALLLVESRPVWILREGELSEGGWRWT